MTTAQSPIKVLQLGNPGELYGAERWILALVSALDPKCVTSLVCVIQDDVGQSAELCNEAQRRGIATKTLAALGRINISAIKALRQLVGEKDIDVVHTHGYKTDIIAAIALLGTKTIHVATPHGWSTSAGPKLKIYEILNRASFYFCDAVAPLSPDLCAGLKRLPGLSRKVRMISNSVDADEVDFAPAANVAEIAGDISEPYLVGYVGQLIERKQVEVLLEAFRRADLGNKMLLIVGKGSLHEKLVGWVTDNNLTNSVKFFGYRPDRLSLLKCFDVFVLPSLLEGIPRCLLESMIAGVPVIASDIPGNADIVIEGETGRLFEPGNVRALANCLEDSRNNVEMTNSMAETAETMIRERFSADRMADEYLSLYESLL